jgi:SWI/SNF chromatin-remodeling complex subunit SWI1
MDQMRAANQTPEGIHPLGDESVIKFLSDVVRYLGTRTMFLRTNPNTLDFMKDLVTLLSNISGYMEIPGREQAMCLLQFLLAFAPTPTPTPTPTPVARPSAFAERGVVFTPYEPTLHPYLPAAVDSLAKLLARDDPNRSYYKAIFALEASGPTPYDLLTRTFALAVSPLPDQTRSNMRTHLPTYIEARMPSIMQGLLAGDILASLAPGHDVGLTRAWITSPSGFAQNLNHLISQVMMMFEARPRQPARNVPRHEQELPETLLVIRTALSMQQKLIEKARDPRDPTGSIPPGVTPSKSLALRALDLKPDMWVKEGVLSLLLACVQLDD